MVEYSALSNHVHMLVESQDERALSRGMNGLAVRIVRGLNRLWKRVGRVFSDRYHARSLTTPRAVRTALVYVIQNARKHGAWIAKRPDDYPSGPSFEGWRDGPSAPERPARDAESASRWLVHARTWLLSIGWKRHGLIDPREVPASG